MNNEVKVTIDKLIGTNVFKKNGESLDWTRGYLALSGPTSFKFTYTKGQLVHLEDSEGKALLASSDAEFKNIDAQGKIVLIKRGAVFFSDKIWRAQKAGAIGCIIYNSNGAPINMAWGSYPSISIPNFMVSQTNGESLVAELQAGNSIEFELGFECVLYDEAKSLLLDGL